MFITKSSVINYEPNESDRALARLGVTSREPFYQAAEEGLHQRLIASNEAFATNAAGSNAYHFAVGTFRAHMLDENWELENISNLAYVTNRKTRVRIAVWNVDKAGDRNYTPRRNSECRPMTREAMRKNRIGMFDFETTESTSEASFFQTWYFLIGNDGSAELALVDDEQIQERIFIVSQDDLARREAVVDTKDTHNEPDRIELSISRTGNEL